MDLIAIDPGLRQCGVALFALGRLYRAFIVKGSTAPSGPGVWAAMAAAVRPGGMGSPGLAIEFPKAYPGGRQAADPADLLELAAVIGAITQVYEPHGVTRYFPREWKGQMDKVTCKARVVERLSQVELAAVERKNNHNVWDAVGIGLFHLGRFDRKRVYAR